MSDTSTAINKTTTAWFNERTKELHTPLVRFVWPTLLEARQIKGKADSKLKFSVSGLIPKGSNVKLLLDGIAEAAKSKFGAQWQSKRLLLPIGKTAEVEALSAFADAYPTYIKASTGADYPPVVFGPDGRIWKGEPSDIYGGRWGVVAGTFYAYDNLAKGVNFSLNHVQLGRHDERIGRSRIDTGEGFEAIDMGDGGPMGDGPEWDPLQ